MPLNCEVYNPNQLEQLVPFLTQVPKWLILGGPADADEAQTAVRLWPEIRVLGAEPNPEMYDRQVLHDWPYAHVLLNKAFSDSIGYREMTFPVGSPRCSTFMEGRDGERNLVRTITIDAVVEYYGPVEDVLLWLDVEGHELEALHGAERLFSSGKVLAVNVEVIPERAEEMLDVERFMLRHGMLIAHLWNSGTHYDGDKLHHHHDRVYVRGEK